MTKISERNTEIETARTTLREMFPAGATVHTVVRHVSQSGMSRSISVLAIVGDEIRDVSWLVARTGLFAFDRNHDGLKVRGTGMDMAFHVVYTLSTSLHGDGYALTKRTV